MKLNYKTILLALTMTVLPSFVSIANACTCSQISPCEAYATASAVFVGVVTKSGVGPVKGGQFPSSAMSTTLTNRSPIASFKVEERFLGVSTTEIEIAGGGTYELSASITRGDSVALVNSKPILITVGKENKPVKLVVE